MADTFEHALQDLNVANANLSSAMSSSNFSVPGYMSLGTLAGGTAGGMANVAVATALGSSILAGGARGFATVAVAGAVAFVATNPNASLTALAASAQVAAAAAGT